MSERGVFAVDRGIFTDPTFASEPFTEREAFLWLVSEAAWKPRNARARADTIWLKRGQLCHSVRFMAKAWQWSKSRVDRFLGRLERRGTISTYSGTGQSVITICNYDLFQKVSLPIRGNYRNTCGTGAGLGRDKLENIKSIESSLLSENYASDNAEGFLEAGARPDAKTLVGRRRTRPSYSADFEVAWKAYPTDQNMSKSQAFTAWQRLSDEDRVAVLASIPVFKEYIQQRAGNYRPVHFERYIKDRRFDGHVPEIAASDKQVIGYDAYLDSLTDDEWREHVRNFKSTRGQWTLAQRTPPPDQPGTRVPPRILAEFHFSPHAAVRPAGGWGSFDADRSAE